MPGRVPGASSADRRLFGDMNPGQVYVVDEFIKELYGDNGLSFRYQSKCRVKDAEIVEPI